MDVCCHSRRGFTLIELMVAISIIALLLLLIFPTTDEVMRSVRKADCASNLQQIGSLMVIYGNDNQNTIPPAYNLGVTFSVALAPYCGGMLSPCVAPEVFYCPEGEAQNSPPKAGYVEPGFYYKGWSGYFIGYFMNTSLLTVIYYNFDNSVTNQPVRRTQVPRPEMAVCLWDAGYNAEGSAPPTCGLASSSYFVPGTPSFFMVPFHPGKTNNVLFLDGHVESLPTNVKPTVTSLPGQTVPW